MRLARRLKTGTQRDGDSQGKKKDDTFFDKHEQAPYGLKKQGKTAYSK